MTDPIDNTKIKVEVGQVWTADGINGYTISKIDEDHLVYYHGSDGRDSYFGSVTEDGYPTEGWFAFTLMEVAVAPKTSVPKLQPTSKRSILDFFKDVPKENCPCNVLRSQCEYHRD